MTHRFSEERSHQNEFMICVSRAQKHIREGSATTALYYMRLAAEHYGHIAHEAVDGEYLKDLEDTFGDDLISLEIAFTKKFLHPVPQNTKSLLDRILGR